MHSRALASTVHRIKFLGGTLQRKEVVRHDERAQKPSIPLGVVLSPTRALPSHRHLVPQEIPRRLCDQTRLGTMCPKALDKRPHIVVQPELADPWNSRALGSTTAHQHIAAHGWVVPLKGWSAGIRLRAGYQSSTTLVHMNDGVPRT